MDRAHRSRRHDRSKQLRKDVLSALDTSDGAEEAIEDDENADETSLELLRRSFASSSDADGRDKHDCHRNHWSSEINPWRASRDCSL